MTTVERETASDLKKIMETEYWNSFGFQLLDDRMLLVGWISNGKKEVKGIIEKNPSRFDGWDLNEKALEVELQKLVPSDQPSNKRVRIAVDDFLGNDYVKMDIEGWELIPSVINRCLELGVRVAIGNKRKVVFQPIYDGNGVRFSLRSLELKIIEENEEFVSVMSSYSRDEFSKYSDIHGRFHFDSLMNPWNWSSSEGKAYCARLRAILRMDPEADPSQNHYLWKGMHQAYQKYKVYYCGGWSGFKPSLKTVDDLIEFGTKKRKLSRSEVTVPEVPKVEEPKIESVDIEECMICLDKRPNTLVLPCMHQVVCKTCSDKLKTTNDRRTCVRCRRPLTDVMEDFYH